MNTTPKAILGEPDRIDINSNPISFRHKYFLLISVAIITSFLSIASGQRSITEEGEAEPNVAISAERLDPLLKSEATSIKVSLAQYVASRQVHRNNPPFDWQVVDHMVLHDIDGRVRAYAFLFAKVDTAFQSTEDIQRHILEKSALLREAQEEASNAPPGTQVAGVTPDSVVKAEEALYNFNGLATVITGATSDSKLILRHFRGIPEFWVNAETLTPAVSTRLYGKTLQVSRVIMITPMDFRLAASEGAERALTKADFRKAQKATIPDSAQCIKVSAKKVESIATVRKERQTIKDRKQRRFNTLEPDERARYEKALKDRAKMLAGEWQQKHESWQKSKNEEEIGQ